MTKSSIWMAFCLAPHAVARVWQDVEIADEVLVASTSLLQVGMEITPAGSLRPYDHFKGDSNHTGAIAREIMTLVGEASELSHSMEAWSDSASVRLKQSALPRGVLFAAAALLPAVVILTTWRLLSDGTLATSSELLGRFSPQAVLILIAYIASLVLCDILANAVAQRHDGHYPWEPAIMVMFIEMGKLGRAAYALHQERRVRRAFIQAEMASEANIGTPMQEPYSQSWTREQILKAALRVLPCAALYAVANVLSWLVLSQLLLSSVTVWRSLSIVIAAGKSMLTGQRLEWCQWLGCASLLIGIAMSSLSPTGSLDIPAVRPLLLCVLGLVCHDLGTSTYRSAFEAAGGRRMVNILNVILYAETAGGLLIFECVRRCIHRGYQVPLSGIGSYVAWILIVLQILMTLAREHIHTHSGGSSRVYAGALREVIVACMAPLFVLSRHDWVAIFAVFWVFFAVVIHTGPRRQAVPMPPLDELSKASTKSTSVPSSSSSLPSQPAY